MTNTNNAIGLHNTEIQTRIKRIYKRSRLKNGSAFEDIADTLDMLLDMIFVTREKSSQFLVKSITDEREEIEERKIDFQERAVLREKEFRIENLILERKVRELENELDRWRSFTP